MARVTPKGLRLRLASPHARPPALDDCTTYAFSVARHIEPVLDAAGPSEITDNRHPWRDLCRKGGPLKDAA